MSTSTSLPILLFCRGLSTVMTCDCLNLIDQFRPGRQHIRKWGRVILRLLHYEGGKYNPLKTDLSLIPFQWSLEVEKEYSVLGKNACSVIIEVRVQHCASAIRRCCLNLSPNNDGMTSALTLLQAHQNPPTWMAGSLYSSLKSCYIPLPGVDQFFPLKLLPSEERFH